MIQLADILKTAILGKKEHIRMVTSYILSSPVVMSVFSMLSVYFLVNIDVSAQNQSHTTKELFDTETITRLIRKPFC